MASSSHGAFDALCERMGGASISNKNGQHENPLSSTVVVPALSSLSPEPDGKDPFRRLPWFAMEDIILRLKDLSTLHQLCQASPAVADYLNHTPGFFPKVVEALMVCWYDGVDISPHPDTTVFYRTLVYLWWKEESVDTGGLVSSTQNPLPANFGEDKIYHINTSSLYGFDPRAWVGETPLPPETPPQCLRRLLSLSSRIRRDTHAFFHGCMYLISASNLQRLKYRKKPWPTNGTRPQGIPIRNPSANRWIISWVEEQRLVQALLKPYIFSELQRIVCQKRILNPDTTPDFAGGWLPHTTKYLKEGNVMAFWADFVEGLEEPAHLEQLASVISWLDEGRPMHGKPLKGKWEFATCCPLAHRYELTREERVCMGADPMKQRSATGSNWAQHCEFAPQSGIKEAGLRGKFRKFGVSFWHDETLTDLGLLLPHLTSETTCRDMAFRWTSLLQRRRRSYNSTNKLPTNRARPNQNKSSH
ncbi:hypothetical protein PENCOP_c007G08968 [Penicillium coprophilum]|uniref:Uncharacterized protein n=1 Tax=Penicillium coprophilum TaxID=36646 RepID=A0A1V6ULK3_9EURO|nr:hypothetical protein PENCOP_c007G08968 [Penicillium coprophilum]